MPIMSMILTRSARHDLRWETAKCSSVTAEGISMASAEKRIAPRREISKVADRRIGGRRRC